MASFDAIPSSLLSDTRTLPRDGWGPAEGNRWVRECLRDISKRSTLHDRPHSWGFTVFRTVYTPESDESVPKAMEALKNAAGKHVKDELSVRRLPNQKALDPAPNEELARRFYSDLVEDKETLDGASPDDVGRRFEAWVQDHMRPGSPGKKLGRYCFCIILDQQGIDHLLQLGDSNVQYADQYKFYVKVVTESKEWREDMGEYFWLRTGIKSQLFGLAFGWPDLDISEMGEPDRVDGVYNCYGIHPWGADLG